MERFPDREEKIGKILSEVVNKQGKKYYGANAIQKIMFGYFLTHLLVSTHGEQIEIGEE